MEDDGFIWSEEFEQAHLNLVNVEIEIEPISTEKQKSPFLDVFDNLESLSDSSDSVCFYSILFSGS